MTEDTTEPAPKVHRGWLSLYAGAFVVLLAAGALLGVSAQGLLDDTRLLVASSAFSAVAIVLAIVAVVVPRRR